MIPSRPSSPSTRPGRAGSVTECAKQACDIADMPRALSLVLLGRLALSAPPDSRRPHLNSRYTYDVIFNGSTGDACPGSASQVCACPPPSTSPSVRPPVRPPDCPGRSQVAQIDGEDDAFVLSLQQQAVLEYTKAVEINPKHVQAQYNCGTLLYCLGDALRAVRLSHRFALPVFPAHDDENASVVQEEHLANAATIVPHFVQARVNLVRACVRARVCVRVCACVRVRACVRACACVRVPHFSSCTHWPIQN